MAIETKAPEKNGTLIQRVTRILFKNDPAASVAVAPVPAAPVESEEKRAERLEAYKKFCAEQSATECGEGSQKKEFKYRAPDFNK